MGWLEALMLALAAAVGQCTGWRLVQLLGVVVVRIFWLLPVNGLREVGGTAGASTPGGARACAVRQSWKGGNVRNKCMV